MTMEMAMSSNANRALPIALLLIETEVIVSLRLILTAHFGFKS